MGLGLAVVWATALLARGTRAAENATLAAAANDSRGEADHAAAASPLTPLAAESLETTRTTGAATRGPPPGSIVPSPLDAAQRAQDARARGRRGLVEGVLVWAVVFCVVMGVALIALRQRVAGVIRPWLGPLRASQWLRFAEDVAARSRVLRGADDGAQGRAAKQDGTGGVPTAQARRYATPGQEGYLVHGGGGAEGSGSAAGDEEDLLLVEDGVAAAREGEIAEAESEQMEEDRVVRVVPQVGAGMEADASVVDQKLAEFLHRFLPSAQRRRAWKRLFVSSLDGLSFVTLLRRCAGAGPVLIAARTRTGGVVGGFASGGLRASNRFYGTGEAFVFSVPPPPATAPTAATATAAPATAAPATPRVHSWSGTDHMITVVRDGEGIGFGGAAVRQTGAGFALFISSTLDRATSAPSSTFANRAPLLGDRDMDVVALEVWGFVTLLAKAT